MAVKLNERAYEHARALIASGKAVLDRREDWSEHQPSTEQGKRFIAEHGIDAYQRWHLGIDDTKGENSKARYKFPCGDFRDVHRCAVLAAEVRAGQHKHVEIELAAAQLHGMLDALMTAESPAPG